MQDLILKKKEIIKFFLDRRILLSVDMLEELQKIENFGELYAFIQKKSADDMLILSKEIKNLLESSTDSNWMEFERSKALSEKAKTNVYDRYFGNVKEAEEVKFDKALYDTESPVKVILSYEEDMRKKDVQDFVQYFNIRYAGLKKILMNRQELQGAISINRLITKKEKESVAFIAMISDKQTTKNNSTILTLEDPTGTIKAIVNKSKPELANTARDLVHDEVIGVTGTVSGNAIFVNNIFFPDVPTTKELKKSPDEAYAVLLSCVHIGSKLFLADEFQRFLDWLSGKVGNDEQRRIASKVKYVFIVGDLVDGVGVYPRQEEELAIQDIYEQYSAFARYLRQIPVDKRIILCPGNHDVVRIAEPQPPIYKEFAPELWELPNVVMVSNPAVINIHAKNGFPGFDVLLYHGFSYSYYGDKVDGIRTSGKNVSERVEIVMRYLLQRRHLAPTHSSTQYLPDSSRDLLMIEKVPDLFLSGHIHKSSASHYRGVTLVSGSCFQMKTDYQEKFFGHEPDPGKIPLINLQTREVRFLKFGK